MTIQATMLEAEHLDVDLLELISEARLVAKLVSRNNNMAPLKHYIFLLQAELKLNSNNSLLPLVAEIMQAVKERDSLSCNLLLDYLLNEVKYRQGGEVSLNN